MKKKEHHKTSNLISENLNCFMLHFERLSEKNISLTAGITDRKNLLYTLLTYKINSGYENKMHAYSQLMTKSEKLHAYIHVISLKYKWKISSLLIRY